MNKQIFAALALAIAAAYSFWSDMPANSQNSKYLLKQNFATQNSVTGSSTKQQQPQYGAAHTYSEQDQVMQETLTPAAFKLHLQLQQLEQRQSMLQSVLQSALQQLGQQQAATQQLEQQQVMLQSSLQAGNNDLQAVMRQLQAQTQAKQQLRSQLQQLQKILSAQSAPGEQDAQGDQDSQWAEQPLPPAVQEQLQYGFRK